MTETRMPTPADELLPYLPIVYVAWADGELSREELAECREHLALAESLSPQGRTQLAVWLDPDTPPSPDELRDMLDRIRSVTPALDCDAREGLAGLGAQLASAGGQAPSASTAAALEALERSLGVLGSEACRELLAGERPTPGAQVESRLDVDLVARALDGPYARDRRLVREFLENNPPRTGAGKDLVTHRAEVREDLLGLARTGFADNAYPELRSVQRPESSFFARLETLALGDLSLWVKSGVQFGLFGGSIHALGTDRHHELLGDVASGKLLGCFAMTELGHGSNVMEIETQATYDASTREILIHTPSEQARKEYIGGAADDARLAVVFAQLQVGARSHGVHAVLVPLRDENGHVLPGVRIEDCGPKLGLNGVDNGRIWFDHVRVPVDRLLDRFAHIDEDGHYQSAIPGANKRFFTMLGTLVAGRVAVASAAVSAAKVGLTIAIRYGARRRQFGPAGAPEMALLDYENHQLRLMPRLATTMALHFAVARIQDRAAHARVAVDEDSRTTETMVAAVKALATWETLDILGECRQCCGGRGYLSETRLPALIKDTDVFATFEGDNVVLMQLVARSLLSDFRSELQESRLLGLLRLVGKQARTAVLEKNPLAVRRTDDEHLGAHEFHRAAFRYREHQLLTGLARRLKRRIDDGMDSFTAFAAVGDHAVHLGRAHAERQVHDAFATAVTSGELRGTIAEDVCRLYALSRLQTARGWFVENDYVSPDKARALRRLVSRLCRTVRVEALPLVSAFGIPDSCLGSLGAAASV